LPHLGLGKVSDMSTPTPSRRGVLTGAAALTAAGYTASSVGHAAAAGHDPHSTRLTIATNGSSTKLAPTKAGT